MNSKPKFNYSVAAIALALLFSGCGKSPSASVEKNTDEHGRAEGKTEIPAAADKASGIETATVGPGIIEEHIALYGAIHSDATHVRHVGARFPGVIRAVESRVGDTVRAGQVLARVESNESLQTYAIAAPIAGTVVQRRANVGDTTNAEPLFEIADYSQVWAQLNVFPRDRARIRVGQSIAVSAAEGGAQSNGSIATIGAGSNSASSLAARVVLDNKNEQWIPGQFVKAEVSIATTKAPLVVPLSALQTFRDGNVVFVNTGDIYQAQPVTLGNRDSDTVEITAGLTAGMKVVTSNSYLVKADIEKSGAAHVH